MTLSNDDAAAAVHRYLDTVATGDAAAVAALFAHDATLEDPVGSPVRTGRDAIAEFYATFEALPKRTRLVTLRTCAGQAAFHFEIEVEIGGGAVSRMAPLEVMTFDDAGLVTSMRAWWADSDMVIE